MHQHTRLILMAALPLAAQAQAPSVDDIRFSVDSRPGTPAQQMYREQTRDLVVGCPADLAIGATALAWQSGPFESWLELPDGSRASEFKTKYTVSGSLPYRLPVHGDTLLRSGSLQGELRFVMQLQGAAPLVVSRPYSVTCLRPDTAAGLYNLGASVTGSDAQGRGLTLHAEPDAPLTVKGTVHCPADLSVHGQLMTRESGRAEASLTLDSGKRVSGMSTPVQGSDAYDGGLPHIQGIAGAYQLHAGQSYHGALHLSVQYPDGGSPHTASAIAHFDVVCQ